MLLLPYNVSSPCLCLQRARYCNAFLLVHTSTMYVRSQPAIRHAHCGTNHSTRLAVLALAIATVYIYTHHIYIYCSFTRLKYVHVLDEYVYA